MNMKAIGITLVVTNLFFGVQADNRTRGSRKNLSFKQNGLRRPRLSEEADDEWILDNQGRRLVSKKSCKYYDDTEKRKKTCAPSLAPSGEPSQNPTISVEPSSAPSLQPSSSPTKSSQPSAAPTVAPSASPSASPSAAPTASPSASPSAAPTASPSAKPSAMPSISSEPSAAPSSLPSSKPSQSPSGKPSNSAAPSSSSQSPSSKPSRSAAPSSTLAPTKSSFDSIAIFDTNNRESGKIAQCVKNPPTNDNKKKAIKFEYAMNLVVGADVNSAISGLEMGLQGEMVRRFLSCAPLDGDDERLLATVSRDLQELSSNQISSAPVDFASEEACPAKFVEGNSNCVRVSGETTITLSNAIENEKLVEVLEPAIANRLQKEVISSEKIKSIGFLGIQEIEEENGTTYQPAGAVQDTGKSDGGGANGKVIAPVVLAAVGLLILISLLVVRRKRNPALAYEYNSHDDIEKSSNTSDSLDGRGFASDIIEYGDDGEVEVNGGREYSYDEYEPSPKDMMWDSSRQSQYGTPRTQDTEPSAFSPAELESMMDDLAPTRSMASTQRTQRNYDTPDTVAL